MRTLYKRYSDDCCGFCKLHHVGVTPDQAKHKKCVERGCTHFCKYKDHWYWTLYETKKENEEQKKKERKMLRKQRKEKQKAYLENLSKGQQE